MTNTEYEIFAKEIYESLLKNQGITVKVEHNIKIPGKATKHQIDVYWEYKIAGVLMRVAIECKNYNSKKNPVSVGRVRDFYGMLADIGNINGIMVTKRKYQEGAKKFAKYYGINLMRLYKPFEIHELYTTSIFPNSKSISYTIGDDAFLKNPTTTMEDISDRLKEGDAWQTMEVSKFDGTEKKLVSQMIKELPHDSKEEKDRVQSFEFEDRFLHIVDIGMIKLKRLSFTYDVIVSRIDFMKDAKDFEISILKDAFDGKIITFNAEGKQVEV